MQAETAISCFVRKFSHVEEVSELINYSCGTISFTSLPSPQEDTMIPWYLFQTTTAIKGAKGLYKDDIQKSAAI